MLSQRFNPGDLVRHRTVYGTTYFVVISREMFMTTPSSIHFREDWFRQDQEYIFVATTPINTQQSAKINARTNVIKFRAGMYRTDAVETTYIELVTAYPYPRRQSHLPGWL